MVIIPNLSDSYHPLILLLAVIDSKRGGKMKKTIMTVFTVILMMAGTSFFYTGDAYARPIQLDTRKLNAITQRMNSMAQSVSKEYAAATVTNRSVPSPDHVLKPAAGLS